MKSGRVNPSPSRQGSTDGEECVCIFPDLKRVRLGMQEYK